MKITRFLLAVAASAVPAFATYTYDYANLLGNYNSSQWTMNGSGTVTQSYLTSATGAGMSLIFGPSLPSPSNGYEVRTTLQLSTSGGEYITYLHASSGSLLTSGNGGTFYAIEVANPTFSGSSCTATLNIYKQVSGSLSNPYSAPISCHNGMVVRSVVLSINVVAVYIDNMFETSWGWGDGSPITSGAPGVGVASAPSTNAIFTIDIGHQDTVAPNPINSSAIGATAFPNHVDFQFPGTTDDPIGTGVAYYQWWRCTGTSCSVNWLDLTETPQFSDTTVQPSTTYTYEIQAQDFHYNTASVIITVTTPAAGAIDPRQVGVRTTGTYWGGGGEQLDMRSGNLNFTVPLLKAMSRGGWGIGFSLNYNSQNWRQDPGGTWQRGRDIGFGYGWKMQAGSLTPVYSSYWSIDHYLFIDSTGAEYRLNVNTNGVWSSQESIYVYYDSNSGLLHFRDGSFWSMLCTSAGNEQDAGTMYPTGIEDSNGNQITVNYNNGVGVTWPQSSARINSIVDVRTGPSQNTYNLSYNSDTPIPHLSAITNNVQTSENYGFSYIENYSLTSPFSGGGSFGTYTMLQCLQGNTIPGNTTFAYDGASPLGCGNTSGGSGPGELSQMTTPGGGHLRWVYDTATYANSVSEREVYNRYLLISAGGSDLLYGINHSNDPNTSVHSVGEVVDAGGVGLKIYSFGTTPSSNGFGLANGYTWENINGTSHHFEQYVYSTDPAGNSYVSTSYSTEDYSTSNSVMKETTQTLDQYGNVTQIQQYNYGSPSSSPSPGSLARTYTNTYLNSSTYTNAYILNRLSTSTVTDGTHTTTLVSNLYDGNSFTNVSNMTMHDSNYGTSNTTRGMVIQSTTPSGVTTIAYDIGGNVTTTTKNGVPTTVTTTSSTNYAAPSQITTNSSLSSTMNWNTTLNLTSATGPNGDTFSVGYAGGSPRPTSTTSPYGAVTNYTYVDTVPRSQTATTCPGGWNGSNCNGNTHWVKTTYDGWGRTIETDAGYNGTAVSTVLTNYAACGCSPLGKANNISEPYAPGGSPVFTTYNYDGLGRTTSTVAPDGSTTSYVYVGNAVGVNYPNGTWKQFSMDAFGNLFFVTEPDPTLGNVNTQYTYDMLNHLTQVLMPRGTTTQTRTFNYANGNTIGTLLLSATNPENGTVTYTYDSYKRLATKTDAKGQVFTYSYDGFNRLTQISVGSTVLRTYIYDSNIDNPSYSQYTAGRLAEIRYPTIAFTDSGNGRQDTNQFTDMFSYTQAGQVAGKQIQVAKTTSSAYGVGSLNVAYAYNSEGKVTSITYPTVVTNDSYGSNTPTFTYTYDQMMRLSTLAESNTDPNLNHYNQPVVNGVTYNAANQNTGMNYYQASETRAYNSLMQLTNITTAAPSGGTGLNITYNYTAGSNNGKIASTTDAISGETVTYQYDSLNRLISASGSGWTQTQAYDSFGNLTGRTGTGSASGTTISTPVNAATNQLTGYGYDANGNQISSGYTYDQENRIEFANNGGVQYFYDGQNKRIWQATCNPNNGSCSPTSGWTLATEQINLYGPDGKLLGSYGAAIQGTTVVFGIAAERAYFGGKLVAQLGSGGYLVSTVQDRLGSTGKYYPYGEERNSPPLPNDQVKFATYTRDSATGNDYADQRYYTSVLGRFMTPDPYKATATSPSRPSNPTSWNRYLYVLGDPINHTDRHGLDCDPTEGARSRAGADDDCDPGEPSGGGGYSCPANEYWDPGTGDCEPDDPQPGDQGPGGGGTPQFQCTFTGTSGGVSPQAGSSSTMPNGFYIPITFDFTASGGSGGYTWSNVQYGIRAGTGATASQLLSFYSIIYETLQYANGTVTTATNTTYSSPTGSTAFVYDAPGVPIIQNGSPLNWATIVAVFSLQVTVSSGGQTVNCPTVYWDYILNISTQNGQIVASGGAQVWTPGVTP